MIIKQISLFLENKKGRINQVARLLGESGVSMSAFSLAETEEFGILRMIVSDVDLAAKILKENNFAAKITEVISLHCSNKPGSLSTILELLASEDIFIEYMYAFTEGSSANIVIRPTDVAGCARILDKQGGL